MSSPLTDDRIDREFRRQELVRRLLAHQARTNTICELTTLSRHQLVTLRERWGVTQEMRYRGPSPRSFLSFWSSSRASSEGAVLAALCRVFGVVVTEGNGKPLSHGLMETGERLCDVYEAYRACFPQSEVNFDRLWLLARGLAQGDLIGVEPCARCESAILVDRLGARRLLCAHCQKNGAPSAPSARETESSGPQTSEHNIGVQQELF